MNKRIKKKKYKKMAILIIDGDKPGQNLFNTVMFGPVLGQALKHPNKNKIYKKFKKLHITE